MNKLLQTLVNSTALGSLYALTALGYTLVYGVLRFINFAHSDVFTVGAWGAFSIVMALGFTMSRPEAEVEAIGHATTAMLVVGAVIMAGTIAIVVLRRRRGDLRFGVLVNLLGATSLLALAFAMLVRSTGSMYLGRILSFVVVMLLAMGVCSLLGITIEALAYRPLRRAPRLNVLITAIGVSLFLQNVGQLPYVFGTQPQRMYPLIADRSLTEIAGVHIRMVDIVVVTLAASLLFALEALVYRTKLGRAMRAVSFDERVASLMGINVNRIITITFGLGSALAAAGGLLFALKYESIKQTADAGWVLLGLKAFVAAVVGGIGNVRGAVAGAMLIAFVEMFGAAYFSPHMRDFYVFAILIGVLLFKPSGLFGKAVVEKV